jgi:hypothetical protein
VVAIGDRVSDNATMAGTPTLVIFAVIALFILAGALLTLGRGSPYDQIGGGGLSLDGDSRGKAKAPSGDAAPASSEREQEIRQLLQARSERRVRQGSEPLDIDAELAALIDPAAAATQASAAENSGLAEEVRQLVIARNSRRERQGQPPLDVETEVTRTLEELGG